MKTKIPVIAALVAVLLALFTLSAAADTIATTPNGTWDAYPGQQALYQTSVQQPINADGSSTFKSNGKAVIPIKFALSQGTGQFVFQSIFSDNPGVTSNDYSFLDWQSATPLTFGDITWLSANYQFTQGNCAGGALRWTVTLNDNGTQRNLDIQYGLPPSFVGNCANGTSNDNLIASANAIYITQNFNAGYTFPSPYNNTYSDAVAQLGSLKVTDIAFILDGGWANGDQALTLYSATVGVAGATPYTDTFTPQASSPLTATCPTQQASIKITKVDGVATGPVDEPISIQPQDNNGIFRIVDCKYIYNLATSSLSGVGTYKVSAVINGVTASNPAVFDLR